MSRLLQFSGLTAAQTAQASRHLFFVDLKRVARSVFRASPEKREVWDCCSSDLVVFDLIETYRARALFLLGVGFYTKNIILSYHNRDMVRFLPLLLRTQREVFNFSSCVCEIFHTSCQIVSRLILLMTYRHVLATVIALNHALKAQKSRQIASIVNWILCKSHQLPVFLKYSKRIFIRHATVTQLLLIGTITLYRLVFPVNCIV